MAKKPKKPEFLPVNEDDLKPAYAGIVPFRLPASRRSILKSASISNVSIAIVSRAHDRRSAIPDSAPCCASISTTSATSRAPSSESGLATS